MKIYLFIYSLFNVDGILIKYKLKILIAVQRTCVLINVNHIKYLYLKNFLQNKKKKKNQVSEVFEMKPRFNMYCLHSLQGQFFGCHFLMPFLKAFRLVNSFSCKGAMSQIFGPR